MPGRNTDPAVKPGPHGAPLLHLPRAPPRGEGPRAGVSGAEAEPGFVHAEDSYRPGRSRTV